MLYIFDKDGTLIDLVGRRPANTPYEQLLLPGVLDKIAMLKSEGHSIALASNQGGVAWGFISMEQANNLMIDCAQKIGGVDAYAFCPHDERKGDNCECRKPKPGMLNYLMQHLGFSPEETIMVGDQEIDQQAAKLAGCSFIWAKDFFGE